MGDVSAAAELASAALRTLATVAEWTLVAVALCVFASAVFACLAMRNPPAVPCPSCTGRPMEFDDCTCREPCGEAWCQAEDPEEPMFYEHGHVIGRDGREAVLRRARADDQTEAEADAMAAEWNEKRGNQ